MYCPARRARTGGLVRGGSSRALGEPSYLGRRRRREEITGSVSQWSGSVEGMSASSDERRPASLWTIHGERVIDDTRKTKFSIASVELPDGTRFEQYVLRMPRAAMVVALNDADEVLMLWRHRFIMDRWTWELPGGYVDPGEDPATSAVRELEEEAGWRARSVKLLATFQPLAGTADFENYVYLAENLEDADTRPDINEAEHVEWVPLKMALRHISDGKVIGAGAQLGLLHAARLRGLLDAL